MTFFRRITISLTFAIAVIAMKAQMCIVADRHATPDGSVCVAYATIESWAGDFVTNSAGLTVIAIPNRIGTNLPAEIVASVRDKCNDCEMAVTHLSRMFEKAKPSDTPATIIIADKQEAWIVEYSGNGEDGKGATLTKNRVPDGQIAVVGDTTLVGEVLARLWCSNDYARMFHTPERLISGYDLRRALRAADSDFGASFLISVNGRLPEYLQNLVYVSPGSPKYSTYIPVYRNIGSLPKELTSQKSIDNLAHKAKKIAEGNTAAMNELRGIQIALEDSISVDVQVAVEQLPEFNDEEIATALLQDLADIWAEKAYARLLLFCRQHGDDEQE